jgi:hypothetical protein
VNAAVPYAYGLTFPGFDDGGYLMRVPSGEWPAVHVTHEIDGPHGRTTEITADLVERSSETGRVVLDRHARTARYYTPAPLAPGALARGYLETAATAFARWEGRDAFHAGGFVADGGGWAVVGESSAGKSTLLAALALAGHDVLGDELLVVDGERAYTSVRFVDLRPPAVELLGVRERVRQAPRGGKWRLSLAPMAPAVPLRGWIFLAWSNEPEVVRLQPSDVLARLSATRLWGNVPTDPRRLLLYASMPSFELRRSPVGTTAGAAVEALLGALAPSEAAA